MMARQNRFHLIWFFGLVYGAAIPLIIAGFLIKTPENTPLNLPASAVMFVLPALAALYLSRRKNLGPLLGRLADRRYTSHINWYLLSLVGMPVMGAATYLLLRACGIDMGFLEISVVGIFALSAIYLISALFEEIGWMGYAFDPMEQKWGSIKASLLLGVLWALLHGIPWVQVHGWAWALGWALFSVAIRVPMTMLYKKAGRTLPIVVVAHASINIVVSLFPGFVDVVYAPYMFAGIAAVAALACVVVKDSFSAPSEAVKTQ